MSRCPAGGRAVGLTVREWTAGGHRAAVGSGLQLHFVWPVQGPGCAQRRADVGSGTSWGEGQLAGGDAGVHGGRSPGSGAPRDTLFP